MPLCSLPWEIKKYKPRLGNQAETYKMSRDTYASNELSCVSQTVNDKGIWEEKECGCLEGVRELGLLLVLGFGPLDDLLVLGDVGWK